MKRILILTFASIFLMNLFGIITNAAVVYENGTMQYSEIQTSANGFINYIIGDYRIENTEEYTITINIPSANNQIPQKYDIHFGSLVLILSVENNEITYTNNSENYSKFVVNDGVVKFNIKKTTIDGNNQFVRLGIKYYGASGETLTMQVNDPILTIQTEQTIEEILIQNVTSAPKDVLREIVAILPVTLSVVITYIATRKGIAFVRSILESA